MADVSKLIDSLADYLKDVAKEESTNKSKNPFNNILIDDEKAVDWFSDLIDDIKKNREKKEEPSNSVGSVKVTPVIVKPDSPTITITDDTIVAPVHRQTISVDGVESRVKSKIKDLATAVNKDVEKLTKETDKQRELLNELVNRVCNLEDCEDDSTRDMCVLKDRVRALEIVDDETDNQIKDIQNTLDNLNEDIEDIEGLLNEDDATKDALEELYNITDDLEERVSDIETCLFDNCEEDSECEDCDADEEDCKECLESECCGKCENCTADDDDYAYEEEIMDCVKEYYGLDSYTVSNHGGSAIVIPLDDAYDYPEQHVNTEEVSAVLDELLKRDKKLAKRLGKN